MASDPIFASTPLVGSVAVSASAMGGTIASPTNTVDVVTAGANGAKIEELIFHGNSTTVTVAGLVLVFRNVSGTFYIIDTAIITAVTPSTTIAPFRLRTTYENLVLAANEKISVVSIQASQLITVTAFGGSF